MTFKKNYFQVSLIIGLIIWIILISWGVNALLKNYEKNLLELFETKQLFIDESDVSRCDSIVDKHNINSFYKLGLKEEYPMGTYVVLTGKILGSGLSIGNRPYISVGIATYSGIGCFFNIEHSSYILKDVKIGGTIKIHGKYRGTMYGNLVLSDCSIIK